MATDGSLLALVFALCGAGALAGFAVPERLIPAFLAWVGSLAALAMLWVSADVLRSGGAFMSELWAIRPLGTLSVSLDRLSALFQFVGALVMLASFRLFRRLPQAVSWTLQPQSAERVVSAAARVHHADPDRR